MDWRLGRTLDTDALRSYERIVAADLERLGEIARRDRESFFFRNPKYAPLREHVIAVWTFYGAVPGLVYPPRRPVASYDFGDPKFGKTADSPQFVGRRVDCLGRSLDVESAKDLAWALRNYLMSPRTPSARELARKAVVIIEPARHLGTVVWPIRVT